LLETIQSVGGAINALDTKGSDNVALFDELKAGLAAPLKGMGTAFSASLLGLSGSLILGFLELQASHAHNRFYNELEEWLSGITELTPGGLGASDAASRQIATAVYDLQRVVEDFSAKIGDRGSAAPAGPAGSEEPVRELARGVNQLVAQMRAEQKVVRQWIDDQASQQGDVANALKQLAGSMQRKS
jgi:hypothetical protein